MPETVGEGGQDPSVRKVAWSPLVPTQDPERAALGMRPAAGDAQVFLASATPAFGGDTAVRTGSSQCGSEGLSQGCSRLRGGWGQGWASPEHCRAQPTAPGRSPTARPPRCAPHALQQQQLRLPGPHPGLGAWARCGRGRSRAARRRRRPARCTCARPSQRRQPRAASRSLPPAAGAELSSGTFRPDFSKLEV